MSYYNAERAPGKVVLYLYSQYTTNPPVPYELQPFLSQEEWDSRIRVVTRTASRSSKPLMEKLWVITSLIATFLIPMVVFRFVDNAFHVSGSSGNSSEKSQKAFEARLISFGIFIGVAILFWTPLVIWKMVGRRRMSNLVRRWAEADVLARGPGAFVPMWWVQAPGIFDSRTVLSVTIPPPPPPPTNFNPNAYLPPYLNPGSMGPPGMGPGAMYPPYPMDQKI